MSEAEFLDWIGHFIQISGDPPTQPEPGADSARRRPARTSPAKGRAGAGAASLAAAPSEAPRTRRGSGSGLALMRSLSGSSLAGAGAAASQAAGSSGGGATPPRRESAKAAGEQSRLAQAECLARAEAETRNDLKAAFCVFDLDGDGYITLDEVRAGLQLLGESWSPNELRSLFSRCSSSPSPSASSSGGFKKLAGSATSSTGATSSPDLSGQRISIDDFVQLLL